MSDLPDFKNQQELPYCSIGSFATGKENTTAELLTWRNVGKNV
jgi:hypothetical protein